MRQATLEASDHGAGGLEAARKLVEPALLPFIDSFPSIAWNEDTLPELRRLSEAAWRGDPVPDSPGILVEERLLAREGGSEVRILLYSPEGSGPRGAVLHVHGGGFVVGAPEASRRPNLLLAAALGCTIVSVAYRLAPETRAPGQVEDCYLALEWMHRHAVPLGIDPRRIVTVGESAGGGIAAALALLVRDRRELALNAQFLIQPMLDDRTAAGGAETDPFLGRFIWTAERNRFGWSAMLGRTPGGEGVPAYHSPARARDLSGLPPTFLSIGALDLFLPETLDFARRLAAAGVPVELHVHPGAVHGFNQIPEARSAQTHHRTFLEAIAASLF